MYEVCVQSMIVVSLSSAKQTQIQLITMATLKPWRDKVAWLLSASNELTPISHGFRGHQNRCDLYHRDPIVIPNSMFCKFTPMSPNEPSPHRTSSVIQTVGVLFVQSYYLPRLLTTGP